LIGLTLAAALGCGESDDAAISTSSSGEGGAGAGGSEPMGGSGGAETGHTATEADITVLRPLAELRRAVADHPEVWPSYDWLSMPIVPVDAGHRALLVNHPDPPSTLPPLGGLPSDIAAELGTVNLALGFETLLAPGMPMAAFVDLGDERDAFAFAYPVAENLVGLPLPDEFEKYLTVAIVIHEMFHMAQRSWTYLVHDTCGFPYDDVELAALAWLEHHTLAQALSASDDVAFSDFVAVRTVRNALDPSIQQAEDWTEQVEGTARFVEELYAQHVFGYDAVASVTDGLTGQRFDALGLGRQRHYATGAAIALVLERMGVAFRERVAAGESLLAIAAETTGIDLPAAEAALDAIKASYDYDVTLLPEASAGVAELQATIATLVEAFATAPGKLVRLDLGAHLLSIKASGFYELEDCTTYWNAWSYSANQPGLTAQAEAVVARELPTKGTFEFHSLLNGDLALDGVLQGWEIGSYAFDSLTVDAGEWSIDTTMAGTLEISDDEVVVTLAPSR
jgi:hypothetical protein